MKLKMTAEQLNGAMDAALADLFERDAKELANHPLPGNRKFGRKLGEEAKRMREAAKAVASAQRCIRQIEKLEREYGEARINAVLQSL